MCSGESYWVYSAGVRQKCCEYLGIAFKMANSVCDERCLFVNFKQKRLGAQRCFVSIAQTNRRQIPFPSISQTDRKRSPWKISVIRGIPVRHPEIHRTLHPDPTLRRDWPRNR